MWHNGFWHKMTLPILNIDIFLFRSGRVIHSGPRWETRTPGLMVPNQARYQLRYTRIFNFCHYITAREKIKDFSVCGHLCGQTHFCAAFGNRGKSRKRRRQKALRRFALPCPGYRHGTPKPPALPTALIPDIRFFCMILCGEGKSKFFVSVGSAVVKAGFAGGSSGGGFPPQATVPRTSGLSLLGEWIDRLSSQSRRATNCATPGYEVVGWPGRILPKEVLSIFYSCL